MRVNEIGGASLLVALKGCELGALGSERPHQRVDLRLLREGDAAQLLDVALAPDVHVEQSKVHRDDVDPLVDASMVNLVAWFGCFTPRGSSKRSSGSGLTTRIRYRP